MDKKRIYILERMPIQKAIFTLAIPSVVSTIVQVFYNITDTFFIGQLNDPLQLAAVSIAMPMFSAQMAISGIFGNGAASYLSRQLGKKDYNGARETATLGIVSCLIASLLVLILGLIFIKPLLTLSGASPQSLGYAIDYMRIILLGVPILMLKYTLAQLLRAEGSTKTVMAANLIGTGANIVLDPLFIFVFKMGVTGAAIATIIGVALGLTYLLSFYWQRKSMAMPSLHYLKFRWKTFQEIFKIGIPTSLSQIMTSIGNLICYNTAAVYGDVAVASFGVVWRVMSLPIFVMSGLAIGIQPLIGYTYGANNLKRMKQTISTCLKYAAVIAVFFLGVFLAFPHYVIMAFIRDPNVVRMASKVLIAFTLATPFIAVQMPLMVSIQAMGKGLPSLIIAVSRNGLVYIPAVYLLNHLFGFNGLVWALPLSDVLSAFMAVGFFLAIVRKLKYHHKEPEIIKHTLEEIPIPITGEPD
ncbi:MAG TPA: MATE family efflux transporter [Candidatus Cloacimonadota bacterium]|nr:MATE family efflux transporter [Candidatus Cloacimonadota bacterium]HQL15169.1 MATE family efflux transporter [Candidatus Cloacimonadota bacterium]